MIEIKSDRVFAGTVTSMDGGIIIDKSRYGVYLQNGRTKGFRVKITEVQFEDKKFLGEDDDEKKK